MADGHPAPGPWLRGTALAAVVGTAIVVATGEWARSHEAAVLGTLALTIGVAASVWFGHRDRPLLVGASLTALGALRPADGPRWPRRADRGSRLARGPPRGTRRPLPGGRCDHVCTDGSRRGREPAPVPLAGLRHAHEAENHGAAPPHGGGRDLRRRGGASLSRPSRNRPRGPCARLRRRFRSQPRPRPGYRPVHEPHGQATGGNRTRRA